MLAQLKTVDLIKEAIQLVSLDQLSIWIIRICGFDYRLKMARNKELSSETHQSIFVLRNEGYSMQEIAKKLKVSYNAVYYSLHRTAQTGPNQNRKRSESPRCTTEQEVHQSVQLEKQTPHKSSTGSFIKQYPQNTSLNVNSEEATPGCWPSRQSCKEKDIFQTGQ